MEVDAGVSMNETELGELLAMYIKALGDVATVSNALRMIDEYHKVLWTMVRIPVKLERISSDASEIIKRREDKIKEALQRIAREMGHSEVTVAMRRFGSIALENVDINIIDVFVATVDNIVKIILRVSDEKVGEFPIAQVGNGNAEYKTGIEEVVKTSLLISRNPWIVDALKRAIEESIGNYARTYEHLLKFYTALKLLTT